MAKDLTPTIGSYVRQKEVLELKLEVDKELGLARWSCACGSKGQWTPQYNYFRTDLARLWQIHVRTIHPEYTP